MKTLTSKDTFLSRHSGFVTISGAFIILSSLTWYQALSSTSPIGEPDINILQQSASITILLVVTGLIAIFAGATSYVRSKSRVRSIAGLSNNTLISRAIRDKKSFRVFATASLAYGISFSFASSLAVYRPSGVSIGGGSVIAPSIVPVVCCGPMGQMPQFVVYLSQQFALLLIPLNLILIFAAAWMVGLNAAIATYSYSWRSVRNSRSWVGGFGAIVTLFSACPTCAGFLLLALLGLSFAVPLGLTIASLQAVFILAGFPILALTPVLAARRTTKDADTNCQVP